MTFLSFRHLDCVAATWRSACRATSGLVLVRLPPHVVTLLRRLVRAALQALQTEADDAGREGVGAS